MSAVLDLFRWVKPKANGGIATGFIVVNSLVGLVGAGWEKSRSSAVVVLKLPAVIGALLGPHRGARCSSSVTFNRVLAGVLIFAGGKLLLEVAN